MSSNSGFSMEMVDAALAHSSPSKPATATKQSQAAFTLPVPERIESTKPDDQLVAPSPNDEDIGKLRYLARMIVDEPVSISEDGSNMLLAMAAELAQYRNTASTSRREIITTEWVTGYLRAVESDGQYRRFWHRATEMLTLVMVPMGPLWLASIEIEHHRNKSPAARWQCGPVKYREDVLGILRAHQVEAVVPTFPVNGR